MVPAALLILIVAGIVITLGIIGWSDFKRSVLDEVNKLKKNEQEDRRKLEEMREFLESVILGHINEARLKQALRRIYSTADDEHEINERVRQRMQGMTPK